MSLFFYKHSAEPLQTHFPPLSSHSFTRTAGPPADASTLLFWCLMGLCAFAALLWLPQLAMRSSLKTKEQRELQWVQDQIAGAQNDLRAVAYHLWGCCCVLLGYEAVLRALSLVFLTPRQLFVQQFFPLIATNQTRLCGALETLNAVRAPLGTGRIPLCSEVPYFDVDAGTWGPLPSSTFGALVPDVSASAATGIVGAATSAVFDAATSAAIAAANAAGSAGGLRGKSAAAAAGVNVLAGPYNHATAEGSTLIVSQLTLAVGAALIVILCLMVREWRVHTGPYCRGLLPQQRPLPAAHAFVARREPMPVSTFFVMAVWLTIVAAAFGYKRAMPVVMRVLFPCLVCFSGAFSLLVQ